MPRGQKYKELAHKGKVFYMDTCPLIKEMYAPGEPEKYFIQLRDGLFEAFDQLEAKGLMGKSSQSKPAI